MDQYQEGVLACQMLNMGLLESPLLMEGMDYQIQHTAVPSRPLFRDGPFEPSYVDSFEDIQNTEVSRSNYHSSTASQSLSPHSRDPHLEIVTMQMPNISFGIEPGRISPTTTDNSRRGSDDDIQRAEVRLDNEDRQTNVTTDSNIARRAQNRAAQRAYRQRKDQGLKQREVEIVALREELVKARRLNKSLCKMVSVLRQRLQETGAESQGLAGDGS